MKPKYIVFLTTLLLLLGFSQISPSSGAQLRPSSSGSSPSNPIIITVNGRQLNPDTSPVMNHSRVLAPLRSVAEALQARVEWDPLARTVTVTQENNTLRMIEGKSTAYINNQQVNVDIPVFRVQGRVIAPVRLIAEFLGAATEWNAGKRTVNIFTPVVMPKGQSTPAQIAFAFNGELTLFDGNHPEKKPVRIQTAYKSQVDLIKWSPDGQWVMFTVRKVSDVNDWLYYLWVVKADGTGAYEVDPAPIDAAPMWSPVGNTIAYTTRKSQTEYPDQSLKLAVIGDGQAAISPLLPKESDVVDFAWAPDGKSLAVSLPRTNKHSLLIDRISLQGARSNLFTLGEPGVKQGDIYTWAATGLKWSPNSRYLAYHLLLSSGSLSADEVGIQVLDLEKPNRPIDLNSGLRYAEWLVWSPDSTKLAYIAGCGREATVNKRVYAADMLSGGKLTDYGQQGFVDIDPVWTAAPQYKLFFCRGVENISWEGQNNNQDVLAPGQRIWVLSEDGKEKPLTTGPANTADYAPVLSPDGEYLFYMRLTGVDNGTLYQRTLSDDKETELVNLVGIGESSFYGNYLPFPYDVFSGEGK